MVLSADCLGSAAKVGDKHRKIPHYNKTNCAFSFFSPQRPSGDLDLRCGIPLLIAWPARRLFLNASTDIKAVWWIWKVDGDAPPGLQSHRGASFLQAVCLCLCPRKPVGLVSANQSSGSHSDNKQKTEAS